MWLIEEGSLSSFVLQSTDYAIISHLVSIEASFPLNIGEDEVKARNKGDIIAI